MPERIPPLQTEHLLVRELVMEDLDAIDRVLTACFGSPVPWAERERWLQWTVLGYEMFGMLDQPHYGERGIAHRQSGELIGAVGIVPYRDTFNRVESFGRGADEPATAEVGLFWAIAPSHQGMGYATEAAGAVLDYLFDHEGLGRVIATTSYDNLASQAVMRKLGMRVEHIQPPIPPKTIGVVTRKERNGILG
jgi:RimJ/RimL family protein N-acetyltransferase